MQHDYQAVIITVFFLLTFSLLFVAFFRAIKVKLAAIYIPAFIAIVFEFYLLAAFMGAFNG